MAVWREASFTMTVLDTDRLILRRFVVEDAEFILGLLNEPSFLQFIGDRGVRTVDEAREYIRNGPIASYERHGFGLMVTELKDDGTPIGMCGLLKRESLDDPDIGFAFLPDFWGKGYAYEAASAVMDYAKAVLSLSRIVAITVEGNFGSIHILEKLGMHFERLTQLDEDDTELRLYAAEF